MRRQAWSLVAAIQRTPVGNLVTNATWRFWLNEGFTVYIEAHGKVYGARRAGMVLGWDGCKGNSSGWDRDGSCIDLAGATRKTVVRSLPEGALS
jgi:hypothetical protein